MKNYKKDTILLTELYSKIYNEDHGPDYPFEQLSDGELLHLARQYGIEDSVVIDGEGGIANPDEVIAQLREVEAADGADINDLDHAMEDEEGDSSEIEEAFNRWILNTPEYEEADHLYGDLQNAFVAGWEARSTGNL